MDKEPKHYYDDDDDLKEAYEESINSRTIPGDESFDEYKYIHFKTSHSDLEWDDDIDPNDEPDETDYPDEETDNCNDNTDEDNDNDDTDEDDNDGCYLTTACIRARHLPDNCYELTTLRSFRDNYLLSTEDGRQLIDEYYRIAPKIVKRIRHCPQRNIYYDSIYECISKCVSLIENGYYDAAKDEYYTMAIELERRFLE